MTDQPNKLSPVTNATRLSLYNDFAHIWPLLSPPEDYEVEAEEIVALISQLQPFDSEQKRLQLLELGAGGGHTLCHLAKRYDVEAVDLSPAMLKQCRELIPGVACHVGDMRTIRLDKQFDAVLVHDAIDYMLTRADASAVVRTAYEHLRPGGIAFFAPTYVAEAFVDNESASDSHCNDQREVSYVSRACRVEDAADQFILDMTMMIRENGQLKIVHDEHLCGLFDSDTWRQMISDAGFGLTDVRWEGHGEEEPWRLFVGIRPDESI